LEKNRKIANARALRHHGTDAEFKLWRFLRNRQIGGFRFRRQAPLGRYIVDFGCMDAKVIVELDGGQHAEHTRDDEIRTEYLERGGFRVLRFRNDDVLLRTDDVLAVILGSLEQFSPHPGPLPRAGEGEKRRVLEASRQSASLSNGEGEKRSPPLSLYIHIPWCVKKCPYCDFNSHGLRAAMPEREYVAALLADLDGDLADCGEAIHRREITSVFFGGGTPSLFAPNAIAAILDGAAARIPFARDCEITLETNPGTVEHGRFDGYRSAGVNRISFGVQSFDDEKLRALGRIHSSAEAENAIRQAQDAGYDNINLDLMYALPQQTLDGALADVERAVALQPAHLSHYQLTLEPGTPFAKTPPPLPDHDAAWDMQEACQARLAQAGYAQYEVSAYALPGRRCRHNLNYWTFGDYLGMGAGAHGKISRPGTRNEGLGESGRELNIKVQRRWKIRSPVAYLQHARTPQRIGGDETIGAEHLPFEFMLNALRLNDGVPIADFTTRTGLPAETIAAPLHEARAKGWLTGDAERLQPTPLGQRFLNDLIEIFLPDAPERPHA
jgi:oxygen-independent coproporphyrinogen-3 oxidase